MQCTNFGKRKGFESPKCRKRLDKWEFSFVGQLPSDPSQLIVDENEERWKQLLAGANNNEVATTYTDYNQRHVLEKARCVLNMSLILQKKIDQGEPCSWKDCCKIAAAASSKSVGWRTL
jgi:hypothetical protein